MLAWYQLMKEEKKNSLYNRMLSLMKHAKTNSFLILVERNQTKIIKK